MIQSLLDFLSVRDMRMIVALYETRNVHEVASLHNLSYSATKKRFDKIHEAIGEQLFEFPKGKGGVSVRAGTPLLVAELRRALHHVQIGISGYENPSLENAKTIVNISVFDMVELPLILALEKEIRPIAPNIQFRTSATAPNHLQNRAQNLDQAVSFLKRGDIDLLLYFEFEENRMNRSFAKLPEYDGINKVTLREEPVVGLVHESVTDSDSISLEQFKSMRRIVLTREFSSVVDAGAFDEVCHWEVCHVPTAVNVIASLPEYVGTPPKYSIAPHIIGKPLKVVNLPESLGLSKMSLNLAWPDRTDKDLVGRTVKDAIIRSFSVG